VATQLVVCSHGNLASGVIHAAEMILGPVEDVLVFGLMPGVSPDVWREEVERAFARSAREGKSKFLVLADLFGGSPCSSIIPLMHEYEIDIVTGLNLGMFLEVYSNLDQEGDLAQMAFDVQQASCTVLRSQDFAS